VNEQLGELLRHPGVWLAAGAAPAAALLPTGFRQLDERLGGGWPRDTLVELLLPSTGIGEFRLLLPALRALCASGQGNPRRWIAWLDPPHLPYAPALAAAGLDPAQMLIVRPGEQRGQSPAGALPVGRVPTAAVPWATEQALRSRACAAALAWMDVPDTRVLRRLKLAAEEGASLGVLFTSAACAGNPSPAALRLLLEPRGGSLDVIILKSRSGTPGRIEGLL
jgi:hypothetical protein